MNPVFLFAHGSTMMLGEESDSATYWKKCGDEALAQGIEHVVMMVSRRLIVQSFTPPRGTRLYSRITPGRTLGDKRSWPSSHLCASQARKITCLLCQPSEIPPLQTQPRPRLHPHDPISLRCCRHRLKDRPDIRLDSRHLPHPNPHVPKSLPTDDPNLHERFLRPSFPRCRWRRPPPPKSGEAQDPLHWVRRVGP